MLQPPVATAGLMVLGLLLAATGCAGSRVDYTVQPRDDGGFTLDVLSRERFWMPTAEGLFPSSGENFHIEIPGKGRDWSYRGQDGYYYSSNDIRTKFPHWDVGYAWIDKNRENLYLNLYHVSSPDGLGPSSINGKYRLTSTGQKHGFRSWRTSP